MGRLLETDALWLQKAGNELAEWEDSFALSESTGRFSVADGASSSVRANHWAAELTTGFIDDPLHPSDPDAFGPWLARRCSGFAEHIEQSAATSANTWYAQEVGNRDAHATFLGAVIGTASDGQLVIAGVAVGDTNVFVVRDQQLAAAWPLSDPADFGRHPDLVTSSTDHIESTAAAAHRWRGALRAGDTVILASDAIAEWALKTGFTDPEVWPLLLEIGQADMDMLIGDLRKAEEIVNDDVTLVRCTVEG